MSTTLKRPCPTCSERAGRPVERRGTQMHPGLCFYCGGPLDEAPARVVLSTERAPSLLDALDAPGGGA